MSETGKVWHAIRDRCPGTWKRIENKVEEHFPDTLYLLPNSTVGLAELKYADSWPARPSTKTDLGIKKGQALFLFMWKQNGGRGFVIARVGDDWLLLPAGKLDKANKEEWIRRAVYYSEGRVDFREMIAHL